MDIQIIDTGYFYADGGAMFGAIPKTAWSRRYPSNETNGCVLAMRSLLVSNVPEKVILIDNGISSTWSIWGKNYISAASRPD